MHKTLCADAGLTQLQIDSLEEQTYFIAMVRNNPEIKAFSHIGAHRMGSDWVWYTNEMINYSIHWFFGQEETNYARNYCLFIINDQADGVGFAQHICDDGAFPFFCQKIG